MCFVFCTFNTQAQTQTQYKYKHRYKRKVQKHRQDDGRSHNWQIYILFDIRLNVEIFRTLYRVSFFVCCAVLCCAVDMLSIVLVHFWLEAIDFSCLHPLSFVLWRLSFPFAVLPLYYFAIYCTLCRRLILTLSVLLCFSSLRKSFLTLSLSLNPYQLSCSMKIVKFK